MALKIMPISDLRRRVSQTIKDLRRQGDAVYITQHGRPQAVLLSYERYEQLLERARQSVATAVDLETIQNDPELVGLVEEIQATPPNPNNIHPATASLAELLQNAPPDPDFDLETWTQQWQAVEAEIIANS